MKYNARRTAGAPMKFKVTWLEDKSDQAVLDEIRRVAALEPGRRLTVARFDAEARIKSTAVRDRFGSWGEATRRAGLPHALPAYTKEAVIEDLQRVSALVEDEPFTFSAYSRGGRYSVSHIRRRFGGWREALDQAGLGERYGGPAITESMKEQRGRATSDSEILEQIRNVAVGFGTGPLSGADIEANSAITQSQMHRRFGSVSAALKRAGVEQVSHGRRYTEDEIFENLLSVWTHYGRAPTAREMDQTPSNVGKNAYLRRFGGWRRALTVFAERASSEVDITSGVGAPPAPDAVAAEVVSSQTPALGSSTAEHPCPPARMGERSKSTRLALKRARPEDRRDPSIGLRFKVLRRDRFKCVLCGDHPAGNDGCVLHVDHILHWSRGGRTVEDNLRTLCARCNLGRGNRDSD